MHRHGYQGRKFRRERDQRAALIRGLLISLFEHGSITTTLPKAKDLRPAAEKLITKARQGDLASRRAVIAALGNNVEVAHRLVDVIAPRLKRDSGYLRIVRSDTRRVGDNTELATIEFVDLVEINRKDATPAKSDEKVETTEKSTPDKNGNNSESGDK